MSVSSKLMEWFLQKLNFLCIKPEAWGVAGARINAKNYEHK